MDTSLNESYEAFLTCAFWVLTSLVIISLFTPAFILPLLPILAVYHRLQTHYLHTSREFKRLDAVNKSPIFAHFGESIGGLSTIRAFNFQPYYTHASNVKIDNATRSYFATIMANRWLSFRLEVLGALIVLFAAVLSITSSGIYHGSIAGLAITSALSIVGVLNWMVRQNGEVEIQMNAVERVLEYSELATEAPATIPEHRPDAKWPWKGSIDFEQVVVRYRPELPPVLHGITLHVGGGEKIGICGRTGCGKSTLTLALYRIMELTEGRISIDGVDISKIGLEDLRSRLALVPQDPVLFCGSVRYNLDPISHVNEGVGGTDFGAGTQRSDSRLWDALRQCGLYDTIQAMPAQLDTEVQEGGANLSVGQRQLLCMARALLRNSKILVLDEATSNVDTEADALIQKTIREVFNDSTTLTIAHRLHTIMDSTRILVLDKGYEMPSACIGCCKGVRSCRAKLTTCCHRNVKELGSPHELLSTPGSHFLTMVEEVGSRALVSSLQKAASSTSLGSLSKASSSVALSAAPAEPDDVDASPTRPL
eukprot:scaffold2004_cov420-Prasinococcus_capsulatus_cf.AAC.3